MSQTHYLPPTYSPTASHYGSLKPTIAPNFTRAKKKALYSLHPQLGVSKKEGAQHSFMLQIFVESLPCTRHISRHQNRPVNKANQKKKKRERDPAFMEIMFYQRGLQCWGSSPSSKKSQSTKEPRNSDGVSRC